MVVSFSKMEAAKMLGISTVDVDMLCRAKVLHSWFREDRDGRYSLHIDAKDVVEYAKQRDGERFLEYVKPRSPKTIRIKTFLDIPDEWHDEDYQRIMRKVTSLYEQNKLDDQY